MSALGFIYLSEWNRCVCVFWQKGVGYENSVRTSPPPNTTHTLLNYAHAVTHVCSPSVHSEYFAFTM